MDKKIKITLNRSVIGRTGKQVDTIHTLGLQKVNDVVMHNDTPSVRGMLNKISHLVTVKEVE